MNREDLKVDLLREKHQQLDDEIDNLNERHSYLSQQERERVKKMKFERLRLRDIISSLESERGDSDFEIDLDLENDS